MWKAWIVLEIFQMTIKTVFCENKIFSYKGETTFLNTTTLADIVVPKSDKILCTLQCSMNPQCLAVQMCPYQHMSLCRLLPCAGDPISIRGNSESCTYLQLQKSGKESNDWPVDCHQIYRKGNQCTGVYKIYPQGVGSQPMSVICDMELEPGGWTVIQSRKDGSVSFDRRWNDYKFGFGTATTEYWLGNEVIHFLTTLKKTKLHISIKDIHGKAHYIEFEDFSISDEANRYRLSVGKKIKGTLDDRIHTGGGDEINNKPFYTPDTGYFCAIQERAGWWFNTCHDVILNGIYGSTKWTQPWHPIISSGTDIKETQMLINR